MFHRHLHSLRRARQHGGSLVIIMLLLLTVGLTVLTSVQLSRNQYQLVGNLQYLEQAFNQAESSVVAGENWLSVPANARSSAFESYASAATPGLYPIGQLLALGRNPATMDWGNANSVATDDGRYLIESLARDRKPPGASLQMVPGSGGTSSCDNIDIFRVVSQSTSFRGALRSIETTYAVQREC